MGSEFERFDVVGNEIVKGAVCFHFVFIQCDRLRYEYD